MLLYPKPLDLYPAEWVDALYPYLDSKSLWELTHHIDQERLASEGLKNYFKTIQRLSQLPQSTLPPFHVLLRVLGIS